MLRMLRDFWTNRKLIWKLAKNDFKTRYAGSYFGVVWAMVQPVVIVLVYWFVFQIGLNNATAELKQGITVPFVLWLVSGRVPTEDALENANMIAGIIPLKNFTGLMPPSVLTVRE